jgi:hypothetical protein
MRLEPGPIPQITSDWLDTSVENPNFTSEFTAVDFELSLLEQQMDIWLDPTLVIDGVLPDDGIFDAVDQAAADTATAATFVDLAQLDPMEQQWTDATAGIINAYQQTPGEAFTPVPPPTDYSGAIPPPIVPGNATVGLYNISRRGATDFIEGENYQINIGISPDGQVLDQYYKVTVTWWPESLTGSPGQSTLGVTDLDGNAQFYGTWPADSAGTWDAVVLGTAQSGAVGDLAHLYWTINPATSNGAAATPAARTESTAPVTVRLNASGGLNPARIAVGENWALTITGPPNSPVIIGGTKNGAALKPVTLGSTDASGNFVLYGQAGPGDVGAWSETYTVGGVAWPGTLNFQVS